MAPLTVLVPGASLSPRFGAQHAPLIAINSINWIPQKIMGERRDPLAAAAMEDQARLIQRMRAANSRIRRISHREDGTLGAKLVNAAVAYGLRPSNSMASREFEHHTKVYAILQALQEMGGNTGNTYSYSSFKKKIRKADAKSRPVSRRRSPIATRQRTKRR